MKKLFIASLFVGSLGSAFASCEGNYADYLRAANQREEARHNYLGKLELANMAGSAIGAFGSVELAAKGLMSVASIAADTDGALLSTAVSPFFAAGAVLGGVTSVKIAEKYMDGEKSASEAEKIEELSGSLQLIKQAQAGQGTLLESYMPIVWKEVNGKVGLIDLAETINTLNSENAFCQKAEELDTTNGIILKAIEALKADK